MRFLEEVSKFSSIQFVNHFIIFSEWVWLCGILLGILLMLSIFIIVTVIVIGPSNFVDECLELVAGYKRETWVFLIAGSKGWNNYRHQVLHFRFKKCQFIIYFNEKYYKTNVNSSF